jgi:small subunit ribosomal protein S2
VIDIRETVKGLVRAKKFIARTVAENGDVLFVGTKRQARHAIEAAAGQAGMPYVAERWLGGTLTNFETIRSRLARLEELEREASDGTLQQYSKKRIARDNRERRKIQRNLEGIRTMSRLPKALVVIDVHREHIAVKEARKLGIPTVCLIDTDSDPDFADIPIPGNDDSMRSIDVVLKHLIEAVQTGKRSRVTDESDSGDGGGKRRRTRRPTTARAEGQKTPTDSEPAAVAVETPPQEASPESAPGPESGSTPSEGSEGASS